MSIEATCAMHAQLSVAVQPSSLDLRIMGDHESGVNLLGKPEPILTVGLSTVEETSEVLPRADPRGRDVGDISGNREHVDRDLPLINLRRRMRQMVCEGIDQHDSLGELLSTNSGVLGRVGISTVDRRVSKNHAPCTRQAAQDGDRVAAICPCRSS